MKSKNKKFLYTSKKPILVFFFFLSLAWLVPSANLVLQGNPILALKLLMFGFGFLIFLFGVQMYFKKMLILYQKNLDISVYKSKSKKKFKK